jgi:hypothetical protein
MPHTVRTPDMIRAAVLIDKHLGQRPTLTPTGSLAPAHPRWMCRAWGSPSTRCVTMKLRENARRSPPLGAASPGSPITSEEAYNGHYAEAGLTWVARPDQGCWVVAGGGG